MPSRRNVYRVELLDGAGMSLGFAYATSQREADSHARTAQGCGGSARIDSQPHPRSASEWLALLRVWGSHADNG